MPRRSAAAAIALLLTAAGCGKPSDPARAVVEDLAAAANRRDASAVASRLAADFRAADGSSRAEIEAELRRQFAMYRSMHVEITGLSIERGPDAARVRFEARVSGEPRALGGLGALLPRRGRLRFDLLLAPEQGAWRVRTADWREATED